MGDSVHHTDCFLEHMVLYQTTCVTQMLCPAKSERQYKVLSPAFWLLFWKFILSRNTFCRLSLFQGMGTVGLWVVGYRVIPIGPTRTTDPLTNWIWTNISLSGATFLSLNERDQSKEGAKKTTSSKGSEGSAAIHKEATDLLTSNQREWHGKAFSTIKQSKSEEKIQASPSPERNPSLWPYY